MAFPTNITKDDLLKAIDKIEKEGYNHHAESLYYDVIFNGKTYPPKLVVSYANLFANGEVLDRNSFAGGKDTPCFNLLKENGFQITQKANPNMSFFDQIEKFLKQAKSGQLGTIEYIREYQKLKVKVSFGQGTPARIPWIAFLKDGQTVSNGIYPVYLFYKDKKLLILAYGISETEIPALKWNLNSLKTIEQYFNENDLGTPIRYKDSFIHSVYDTSMPLDEEEIDSDLNEMLNLYNQISLGYNDEKIEVKKEESEQSNLLKEKKPMENFNHSTFYESAQRANFFINEKLALRFVASLLTKPFVILTGLSGSGKSKLAQAFSIWLCESEKQFCIIPVGADWTNREPLLGFPNALETGKYVKPDNRVLDLIIEAKDNAEKPYFLILDEMNLSHVERYFADFLSVMESHQDIFLHAGSESWSDVPANVSLPKNLFIIGTVNIDETTYMFSPKVLDRANVIEFRVTADEMEAFLSNSQPLNVDTLQNAGANMASSFVSIANDKSIVAKNVEELNNTLITFFNELKKTGAEFGFRTASEILRFTAIINRIEPNWKIAQIIDVAIMQKLLPKVHGSRRKLEPILKTLAKLCLKDQKNLENYLSAKKEINSDDNEIEFSLSLEKIVRMNQSLLNNGFTSYAEA